MPFDVSTLAKGQRWRVHYVVDYLVPQSFDFTLNKKVPSGVWSTIDCTSNNNVSFAHEQWWNDKSNLWIMVLLCSNVDHK